MGYATNIITEIDFNQIITYLKNNSFLKYLFPFLLLYSLLYVILSNIKLFKTKEKKPLKSVITIISLVISIIGTIIPISNTGRNLGDFISSFFPNVSAIGIFLLTIFIISSMLGKNFLDFFSSPSENSFAHFIILFISFGAMLFYLGIYAGLWNYDSLNPNEQWNFYLAVSFVIIGIILIILKSYTIGTILLLTTIVYISNGANSNILSYLFDPIVFIVAIIFILLNWIQEPNKDKKYYKEEIKDIYETMYSRHSNKLEELLHKIDKGLYDYKDKILPIEYEVLKNRIKDYNKLTNKDIKVKDVIRDHGNI